MKLVVGLGNIGKEYDGTRHNIGFALLDHVAEEFGVTWQERPKFKARVAELGFGGEKVVLAKPTTFYNLSGEAVRALSDFYKIDPEDILVIHDELALPFGTIRTRGRGTDAGNNGIKNITAHVGPEYARIRVGTANEQSAQKAEIFVLKPFTKEEQGNIKKLAEQTARFVEDFIHEDKEFAHTSVAI